MPVHKYRSIDEMKTAREWYEPGTPEHLRAISQLWRASRTMYPAQFPPGV